MKIYVFLFLAIATGASFLACNKDKKQAKKDREAIVQYLTDHSLTATEDPSGIFYIIDTPGSGGHPTLQNQVTVSYKGYLLDGSVFDQTGTGKTVEFPLSNLIEGWQIGIPLLAAGGHGTFFIPSGLGYGSQAQGGIPANSPLIFEIGLKSFR